MNVVLFYITSIIEHMFCIVNINYSCSCFEYDDIFIIKTLHANIYNPKIYIR